MPELIAYRTGGIPLEIVPAPATRTWMEERPGTNRCLPLRAANQWGWVLLNPVAFVAEWNGGSNPGDVRLTSHGQADPPPVSSHFDDGIITWTIPYLFRTSPGWWLLVKGPGNQPKDGATSLEGLVETDWAVATFTHNWKLTRPNLSVHFRAREPFCCIVPQLSDSLSSFETSIHGMREDQALLEDFLAWRDSRATFMADADRGRRWQKHYFAGRLPHGRSAPPGAHRTTIRLSRFLEGGSTPE